MRKRAGIAAFVAILFLWTALPPPAEAQRPPRRVAVLEFQNETGDKEFSWLSVTVPSTLTTKLNAVRALTLIERAQLDKIIKEQRFQLSDLVDPKKAVRLGRLAGAQVVVLGSFTRFQNRVLFNTRFVDVETGVVLHTAQARGATDNADRLFDSFNRLADAAIEALNTRVVVAGGERQVAKAPEAERISATPGEREKLHAPPAASLTAYELHGKGLEAYKGSRWDEAIGYFRQVLEKEPDHADGLKDLGRALDKKGRLDAAMENYERALALYRRKGDKKGEAWILNNIGVIHVQRGQYNQALELYEKSLEISSRIGDEARMAMAYGNIGGLHYYRGQYRRASEFFEKSLDVFRRLGDEIGMASAYTNIGKAVGSLGDYERAREYLDKSLEIDRRLGELRENMANTHWGLANYYAIRASVSRAIAHMEEALRIYRALGSPHAQRAERELQRLRRAAGR